MKTNSNCYTIIYSVIIVVIVAFLLAFVSSSLKPTQDANVALGIPRTVPFHRRHLHQHHRRHPAGSPRSQIGGG